MQVEQDFKEDPKTIFAAYDEVSEATQPKPNTLIASLCCPCLHESTIASTKAQPSNSVFIAEKSMS